MKVSRVEKWEILLTDEEKDLLLSYLDTTESKNIQEDDFASDLFASIKEAS